VSPGPEPPGLGRAVQLLQEAHWAIALTGAGVSTRSGLPDFRSPGTGLWERQDPSEVASLLAFRQDPASFLKRMQPFAGRILQAQPNPAHQALAQMEAAGRLQAVITQNVDGLHQKAGSVRVLEVHGHLRQATCIACYHEFPAGPFLESFALDGTLPVCPDCGGLLKPNIILMGEQLPHDVVRQAKEWVDSCDLILVAGSSLEITPAAAIPYQAVAHGARCIIVNIQPTYMDARADVVIHDDVATILPLLAVEVAHESKLL
jgi:NAD-dependent deacetylase